MDMLPVRHDGGLARRALDVDGELQKVGGPVSATTDHLAYGA